MQTINFVRKRRRELSKVEVQDQQYLKYAFYIIGGVLALFIITIGVRIGLSIFVSRTNEANNLLTSQIDSKQAVEGQYVIFMKKVETLVDLFSQRKEKQEAIEYFSSLFEDSLGVRISQLSYSAETHTLDFTLRAPTVFVLEEVFATLKSEGARQRYPTFTIAQLGRDDVGAYGLQINLPLPTRPADEMLDTQITPLLDEFGEPIPQEGELPIEEGAPVEEGAQAPAEPVE